MLKLIASGSIKNALGCHVTPLYFPGALRQTGCQEIRGSREQFSAHAKSCELWSITFTTALNSCHICIMLIRFGPTCKIILRKSDGCWLLS